LATKNDQILFASARKYGVFFYDISNEKPILMKKWIMRAGEYLHLVKNERFLIVSS